ncbi:hypothetical protein [Chryseobacterium sp. SL1]|uniref:hypothetical protein n=1 Tax=Chryseobacterium sp. SL1 TaxID=2995159 RepID=UPI002272A314|nr:hypothetical protein [Chryseobacterium sp. SL1]MCY1660173.1 hypothetical protein [Chryseobacterium sp. SL1]
METNIENIGPKNVMVYDFRKAIDIYNIPRLAFKYDNIGKGENTEGFPNSISKFIPVGEKVKILDATWISKAKNKEIQVWYTQDKNGLWIPFNAEERKVSNYFLENQ